MLSYRQVRVGPHLVGLVGLDELFARLQAAGRPATEEVVPELLAAAGEQNYIPAAAGTLYGEALREAYARYLAEEAEGKNTPGSARTWRGIPREQVPWFPTLYADRCDGCGRCLSFCPNGVFELSPEGDKAIVAAPLKCEVGCSACAAICPPRAIVFPSQAILESAH